MSSIILYAQTNPVHQTTNNAAFVDMAGLTLTLPAASATARHALLILDVPNPYAIGSNFPGANFRFKVNNVVDMTLPIACFTYFVQNLPGSSGRMPTNLVARVKLGSAATTVQAVWQSVRSSKVIVDTPCSISAVLGV
ncbi:MAG TPA: hypothetical protein VF605_18495 [Allosphingosinicella sp.]|jgi:hypothetical protein